jgi:chemotaxis protein CheD
MNGLKKNIIVGISDSKISRSADEIIVTYSLGSCIGVCLYDRRVKIGGLFHFQLPDSKLDENKARIRPFMFADTGLVRLLQGLESLGCQKRDLAVKMAGGAAMQNGPANFEIGKRNSLAIRKGLWKAGLLITAADLGGEAARNLYLDIETGAVTVKAEGFTKEL